MTPIDSQPPELPASVSGKGNHRTLRGCMLALAVAGILFSLSIVSAFIFISTEGTRAENEWNDFKDHWEAKGEIFDIEKIIPSAIPEKDNFAATAIIRELYDGDHPSRLSKLDLKKISGLKPAMTSSLSQTTPKWQLQALGAPSLDIAAYLHNPTLFPDDQAAATSILATLKPLEPIFDELSEASRLPKANFPIDYSKPFSAELKHVSPLLASIKTLALRARVRIATGDSEGAREDILTTLRLGNLAGSEPSLISSLVEATIFKIALTVIWEGLDSNKLDSADLKQIGEALEKQNLKPRLVMALRYERAAFLAFIDSIRQGKTRGSNNDKVAAIKSAAQSLKRLGLAKSFFYKNMLNYSRFIQEHGLISGEEINWDWINLEATMNASKDLKQLTKHPVFPKNPYTLFAAIGMPSYEKVAQSIAQTSTRGNLSRIAIALELYRRDNHTYPAAFGSLVPTYINPLPYDLISDSALHYRIKSDGTPLIYSIGLNNTDENGLLKKDLTLGDWVWQYTVPENLIEKDWRE